MIGLWLNKHVDAQIALLAELVRCPSDNPPGDCDRHADLTASLLEDLGLTVERHKVPADVVARYGMRSVTNLVVRHRFGPEGKVIALNAHGDVVPPGDGWSADPYGAEIRDGAMYGRGVAVSKSDIATYAIALKALIEGGETPVRGAIELHVTYDEEAGGFLGPAWLLEQGVSRPDMAICAGFGQSVVTGHNGVLHLETVIQGQSAHAANPALGVDALEAANAVLTAIYDERRRLRKTVSALAGIGSPQITVGMIAGGINTNVVPDKITLRLDRRLIPEEDAQAVEADLRQLIEIAASSVRGASAACRTIMLAAPLKPEPGQQPLLQALQVAAGGRRLPESAVPLYTDARHYQAAGVPVVLFGAGPVSIAEANAHGPDEHLRLTDLAEATDVVALALKALLDG
jgi:succinyl-diaminopimelate desuccinylase